jgi:hypothetical protein
MWIVAIVIRASVNSMKTLSIAWQGEMEIPTKTIQSGLTSLIESPRVVRAGVAYQLGGSICPITNG